MEAIASSIHTFSRIAEHGMVRSKNNIMESDLSKIEDDFCQSVNDLGNSYKKVIEQENEQQE